MTTYKVISKIFVNRLRLVLDNLISPFQTAFVPRRSIHDNILLKYEIIHKFRNLNTKIAWIAIKLDMKKAYNRIKWDFILKCLHEMGFHSVWNSWISKFIASVSYSLIVNYKPNDLIKSTKELDRETHSLLISLFCVWKPLII